MVRSANKLERMKRFFYKNPSQEVHVRDLAERIDCSAGFVSENIGSLVEEDVVKEKRKGNMRTFIAKTASTKYKERKKASNIQEILTSGLGEHLENKLYPDAIVLFGSYLKGTDTEDSDIDIAVINGRKQPPNLSSYEEIFERSISLTQIDSLEEAENNFVNTLANGLVLKGYLEVTK